MNPDTTQKPTIIYEDEFLVVIDKPSGLASTPAPNTPNVLDYFSGCQVVHRLDTRATGLLILAKNAQVQTTLTEQFADKTVQKVYAAVTKNTPTESEGVLQHWLVKQPKKAKVFAQQVPNSKQCELSYQIVQKSERYALWRIVLATGRFHQIRAQLAAIKCPIVGDTKYGFARTTANGSIYLQAAQLSFVHPITGKELAFTLAMPEDWQKLGLVP
jgi:23S rRNA pseudouridine1911/1915/1917 synthase